MLRRAWRKVFAQKERVRRVAGHGSGLGKLQFPESYQDPASNPS